jgi:uncharacterized protein with HEPN domain
VPIDERDQALLYDMLSAAQHLQMMWAGRAMSDLLGDKTLQWATDRGSNILGEAARRISDATKALYPGIEWRRIIGCGTSLCMTTTQWTIPAPGQSFKTTFPDLLSS